MVEPEAGGQVQVGGVDPMGDAPLDREVVCSRVRYRLLACEMPDFLEGSQVMFDNNGFGDGQAARHSYARFGVRCPLADSRHACASACFRWRNAGPQQTIMFGILEVVGYLGAWLRSADLFSSKAAHKAYRPSSADVLDYLLSGGYIVQVRDED